jgi:hypothetical protein
MAKPHHQNRADHARRILDAARMPGARTLEDRIFEHLIDLGHLCDASGLGFVEQLKRAIRFWAVERVDPDSTLPGPVVEIVIGTDGLPLPPSPGPHRKRFD